MNTSFLIDRSAAVDGSFFESFDSFALSLSSSLTLSDVLGVSANDGRVLLNCDRVSVGIRYGDTIKIKCVSGQDRIVNRSNSIRMLEKICEKPMRSNRALTFGIDYASEDPADFAEYVFETHVRTLIILPLTPNNRAVTAPQKEHRAEKKAIGVLVVEQFEKKEDSRLLERAELIVDHVANAVNNSRTHNTIFGLALLSRVGRILRWFEGKKLWTAMAMVVSLLIFLAACISVETDYRVSADGTLMPIVRREVFAPWDSLVAEVFVEDGQKVAKGTPLLRLESSELETQLIVAQAAVNEKQKLAATLESQINQLRDKVDSNFEFIRLQGELKKAEIELAASTLHLEVITERMKELLVLAPISGVVVTFQIEQLLLNRPVTRGEQLLHVVDPNGEWQIELNIQETRVGHILHARNSTEKPLPVEFSIATDVEQRVQGTLTEMSSRVNESEKHGAVVNGIVRIDAIDQLERRHVGAEVVARIHCGHKCLGYVLFGDVIEFLARRFWI